MKIFSFLFWHCQKNWVVDSSLGGNLLFGGMYAIDSLAFPGSLKLCPKGSWSLGGNLLLGPCNWFPGLSRVSRTVQKGVDPWEAIFYLIGVCNAMDSQAGLSLVQFFQGSKGRQGLWEAIFLGVCGAINSRACPSNRLSLGSVIIPGSNSRVERAHLFMIIIFKGRFLQNCFFPIDLIGLQ